MSRAAFHLAVSSAAMTGLFGDAGAVLTATWAGEVARAGAPVGRSAVGPATARARGATPCGPRGFTLLELLITLSVTTVGLIGLLSLHLGIVRGNDGASRAAEAQQITAARLESLRALRAGDLMQTFTGSSTVSIPIPLTPPKVWTVPGRAQMSYTVTATVGPVTGAPPSLIRIRVVTTWTEDGGTFGVNPILDHALALEVLRTAEDAP